MPAVSVIMPARNEARTIVASCQSILQQSFRDLDLIVIDDGSSDATRDCLENLQDARLRVVENAGDPGISGALNTGLAVARGAFIARMDADDLCHRQRIQRQMDYLASHPQVDICGTALRLSDGSVWRYPQSDAQIKARLLFNSSIPHPAVLMRSDAVHAHGLRYESALNGAEDYGLWVENMEHLGYANLPDILYEYRVAEGRVIQSQERRRPLADEVRRRVLAKLGIVASEEELRLHNAIAGSATEIFALEAIDFWLQKLLKANSASGLLEPSALMGIVTERLFSAARQAALHDAQALRCYRRSALRGQGPRWRLREGWAALRAWRYRISNSEDRHDRV